MDITSGTRKIIIAIDGPAASGKSTTARLLARKLGYTYIDTGAMYRSVTLKAFEAGLLGHLQDHPDDATSLLEGIDIAFEAERVLLDGKDVTEAIRDNRVSRHVSFVSSLKPVRDTLKQMQRAMGEKRGVVMDGRDIGTVVFPDAELKIFLVADASERAKRRYTELVRKSGGSNNVPSIKELEQEILQRDRSDAERTHAPLKKHQDAVEVDTSGLTIDEQVALVYNLALEKTAV
ncbi:MULTISPECIES: (d)CMP kinase [Prosthecochloris]|uniref:Cytidylate kinase n=1 Tax=Prosthecochloris marina TaxID=2017681 RepID=A0A317T798_9CHLB|nr:MULTISPECIES: (d)CMP kinase [Prosthecochloris]PWW82609.1 cytidylate kinase [Prosthecochloris marina]UZJ38113.1 (d)CMP kinase [Prosthecochloris sp. SCSIO W1103]